jgi:hypothetical protein
VALCLHSPRSGTKWSSKIITLHIQESADYLSEIEKYLGLVYEQFTPTATRSKHRQNTKHSSQTCTWLPLAIWIEKHLLPLREMNRQWTFVPQRKASKEERRAKKMKIVKTTIQEYKIPQWTEPWSRHYIQGTTKLHPLPFTNCATRNISPRNLLYYRATFHINRLKKNRLYIATFPNMLHTRVTNNLETNSRNAIHLLHKEQETTLSPPHYTLEFLSFTNNDNARTIFE